MSADPKLDQMREWADESDAWQDEGDHPHTWQANTMRWAAGEIVRLGAVADAARRARDVMDWHGCLCGARRSETCAGDCPLRILDDALTALDDAAP